MSNLNNILAHPFLVSALCGAAGQGIRALVGIKKLLDTEGTVHTFNWARFAASLACGAVAGSWAYNLGNDPWLWLAFGYAGSDAIEGFVRKAG